MRSFEQLSAQERLEAVSWAVFSIALIAAGAVLGWVVWYWKIGRKK